ncbi:terpenoid synthase [Mycena polygramma]|nr:terpenoid synthase [Mycena polygramma]
MLSPLCISDLPRSVTSPRSTETLSNVTKIQTRCVCGLPDKLLHDLGDFPGDGLRAIKRGQTRSIKIPTMSLAIRLPDILANWPWPRALNPNYADCRLESQEWSSKFRVFSTAQQRAFDLCDPSLLASLAYPTVTRARCRVVCDLLYIFGMFDDCSDVMEAKAVEEWADIIMHALRNPHSPRPTEEPVLFWSNALKVVGSAAQKHFIEEFGLYTKAVVEQARDRDHVIFRDVESYMVLRRNNLGAKPAFALLEMDVDIPENIYEDPALDTLRQCAVDMICLANDLYSFNVEQAKGDDHNIVTLMIIHEHMAVQEAIDRVSAIHDRLATEFLDVFHSLPSFGSPAVDSMVRRYVDGLGNWIRANECWSFETWRYFKNDGLRVQRERLVDLLPRDGSLLSIVA